jgi:hypothetical protein
VRRAFQAITRLGLGEAAAHQLLDRAGERGVGDVALRGVEVAARDGRSRAAAAG